MRETAKIIDLLSEESPGENPANLAIFQRQVQRTKGKIQILVHPYLDENLPENPLFPKASGYSSRRDKFIKTCAEKGVPLILFEQKSEYGLLEERLGQIVNPVFIVMTYDKEPLPLGEIKGWVKLMGILRKSGVKHIMIGGQYLYFFEEQILFDPNKDDKMPREIFLSAGCVGSLARHLWLQKFKVTLSPISSPRLYHNSPKIRG